MSGKIALTEEELEHFKAKLSDPFLRDETRESILTALEEKGMEPWTADIMVVDKVLDRPGLDDGIAMSILEALAERRYTGVIASYMLNDRVGDDVLIEGLRVLAEAGEYSDIHMVAKKDGLSERIMIQAMESFLQALETNHRKGGDTTTVAVLSLSRHEPEKTAIHRLVNEIEERGGNPHLEELFEILLEFITDWDVYPKTAEIACRILSDAGHEKTLHRLLDGGLIKEKTAKTIRGILDRNPLQGDGMLSEHGKETQKAGPKGKAKTLKR